VSRSPKESNKLNIKRAPRKENRLHANDFETHTTPTQHKTHTHKHTHTHTHTISLTHYLRQQEPPLPPTPCQKYPLGWSPASTHHSTTAHITTTHHHNTPPQHTTTTHHHNTPTYATDTLASSLYGNTGSQQFKNRDSLIIFSTNKRRSVSQLCAGCALRKARASA